MKYLRVVNHERHQHYKNRNPPWIKLHRSCLDSYRFTQLSDAARWHALGIALLASQTDNHVPADPAWLKSALHATARVDVDKLIAAGFLELCSNGAGCKHCASVPLELEETETETETETEKTPPSPRSRAGARSERFDAFWNAYPKKVEKKAAERAFAKAERDGMPPLEEVLAALERQKQSRNWNRDGGQFIKYPATWLNKGCWADEVTAAEDDAEEGWYVVRQ